MATRFDDTTADHKLSTAGNWSAGIPDAADAVTIGAAVTSLIIDSEVNCLNFNASGTSGITISGSGTIHCRGDFTLDANVTWTHIGNIYFWTNACNITTAGVSLNTPNTILVVNGADVSLQDALSAKQLLLYQNGSSLTTNNYNMTVVGLFGDNGAGAVTLSLGTSVISCGSVIFDHCTLTMTDANHTINIAPNTSLAHHFGGVAWGIINFTPAPTAARTYAITPGSGASFKQFNITHNGDFRDTILTFANDFSVGDNSSWLGGGVGNDNPTYRPLIRSSTIGTTRTITVSAASKTLTFTDIDLQDIKIADTNTPTVTLTRVGDCGGNTKTTGGGYIQDVSDPKTVYADAGTANFNWYDNIWSTSSGGGSPSLNNYHLPQDIAVIDNLTWDDTGNTATVNDLLRVGAIDVSALTEADTLALATATYYGDLTLTGSGLTVTSTSDTITLDARVASVLSINRNGSFGSGGITVYSYGGTVQLSSALVHTGAFTLTQGTFDINGQTLTCAVFSSSNSNTRELKDSAGSGKIILNGLTGTIFDMSTTTGLTVSDAPDIDIGDSNNTLTADVTFAGGGKTFGDLKITKHAGNYDCIITGSNTFGSITLETPDATYQYSDIQFTSGTDQDTSLAATGTDDYNISIKAVTGGVAATLSDTTGTSTVSYCVIQDMTVEGGAIWDASDGTNTNVSGNTGWTWPTGGVAANLFFCHG